MILYWHTYVRMNTIMVKAALYKQICAPNYQFSTTILLNFIVPKNVLNTVKQAPLSQIGEDSIQKLR